jgi:O-acetyl-ADP-ribose deacetylase (regulator of RNase III)
MTTTKFEYQGKVTASRDYVARGWGFWLENSAYRGITITGGGASAAQLKAAQEALEKANRDKARLAEINALDQLVIANLKKGGMPSFEDIFTSFKPPIYQFIYLDQGEIKTNSVTFWTNVDTELQKDKAKAKAELDKLKAELKAKVMEPTEPAMETRRTQVLAELVKLTPAVGKGRIILQASKIEFKPDGTTPANGGNIELTIETGTFKPDFKLDHVPALLVLQLSKDAGTKKRYDDIKNEIDGKLKKDLTIEIKLAEKIETGWNTTTNAYALVEDCFSSVTAPLDPVLVKKKTDLIKLVEDRLTEFSLKSDDYDASAKQRSHRPGADRPANWKDFINQIHKDGKNGDDYSYEDVEFEILISLADFVADYFGEITGREFAGKGTKNQGQLQKYIDKYRSSAEITSYKGNEAGIKVAGAKIVSDWLRTLRSIKDFLSDSSKSDTLAKVKKWAEDKFNETDPLDGIDKAGVGGDELLKRITNATLSKSSGASSYLASAKWTAERFKNNYESIGALGDGNCGLNSMAVLLIGSQDEDVSGKTENTQQNVANRLRAAVCLEIMKNEKRWENYPGDAPGDAAKLKWLKDKMLQNKDDPSSTTTYPLTDSENGLNTGKDHAWIATDDYKYFSDLLSRPITVIYKQQVDPKDSSSAWLSPETGNILATSFGSTGVDSSGTKFTNEDPFVILNMGGGHFDALVLKKDHEQGKLEFTATKIELNSTSAGGDIKFETNSLNLLGFTNTTETKIKALKDFASIRAVRIVFGPKIYKVYEAKFAGGINKAGREIIVDVWKAFNSGGTGSNFSMRTDGTPVELQMNYYDDVTNVADIVIKPDPLGKYSRNIPRKTEPEYDTTEVKGISSAGTHPKDKKVWPNKLPRGIALLTESGQSAGITNIVHIGFGMGDTDPNYPSNEENLILAVQNAVLLAEKNKLASIAFPLIEEGITKITKEKLAEIIVNAALYQREDNTKLEVKFVDSAGSKLFDDALKEFKTKNSSNANLINNSDRVEGEIQTPAVHNCVVIVSPTDSEYKFDASKTGIVAKIVTAAGSKLVDIQTAIKNLITEYNQRLTNKGFPT